MRRKACCSASNQRVGTADCGAAGAAPAGAEVAGSGNDVSAGVAAVPFGGFGFLGLSIRFGAALGGGAIG